MLRRHWRTRSTLTRQLRPRADQIRVSDVIRAFRVTGRVQGVFFRQSTCREAEHLKLRGYARNMSDGSVRVLAGGPSEAVQTLRVWLGDGPEHARVAAVEETDVEADEHLPRGFESR